jgi:DNA polymerase bacteriophage-type
LLILNTPPGPSGPGFFTPQTQHMAYLHQLHIDIETFCEANLKKVGLYRYSEDPTFEILCIAYRFDSGPMVRLNVRQERALGDMGDLPDFLRLLENPTVQKWAYNAAFERVCLSRMLGYQQGAYMDPRDWFCTMALGALAGYPLGLDRTAMSMGLSMAKDVDGKRLIKLFSVLQTQRKGPDKGKTYRVQPEDQPGEFARFMEYCGNDVLVEEGVLEHLRNSGFKLTEFERRVQVLDQRVNDKGIRVDLPLVGAVLGVAQRNAAQLTAEAVQLTGLENPGSVSQLKDWLNEAIELDSPITSLNKAVIDGLRQMIPRETDVARVLAIRNELSKSSLAKFYTMAASACADGRMRGLHQYCGAIRTARWAGRLVQVQNLIKTILGGADLDDLIELVRGADLDNIRLLYGGVSEPMGQLLRPAMIPKEGHVFVVSDFSAIEARVLAALAGEQWRLDAFKTHGKIYEASVASMYDLPIESIEKTSVLRQKGKLSELGLGYQGGVNALSNIGVTALTEALLKYRLTGERPKIAIEGTYESAEAFIRAAMHISDEDKQALVDKFRVANLAIVHFWDQVGRAAYYVTDNRGGTARYRGVEFSYRSKREGHGTLVLALPSGRKLHYHEARISTTRNGRQGIVFAEVTDRGVMKTDTYGGKLTENIVQAVSRDCLAEKMLELERAGYVPCIHVHDEVVIEVPADGAEAALKEVNDIMSGPVSWLPELPMKAAGSIMKYYKKD